MGSMGFAGILTVASSIDVIMFYCTAVTIKNKNSVSVTITLHKNITPGTGFVSAAWHYRLIAMGG